MLEAGFWGLLGGSSLVVGALVALATRPRHLIVGLIMAFGAGMLITSVSYELVGEAIAGDDAGAVALAMLLGAMVYVGGDMMIDRLGGDRPRIGTSGDDVGNGPAIVLGAVLDGIPESFVLGLTVVSGGGVNVAFMLAVFISNFAESLSASASLSDGGWARGRIIGMWALIALVSGAAAMLGYAWFEDRGELSGSRVQAFAAGAILAMLADAMMPDGFKWGGRWAGLVTVLGFVAGIGLNSFDQ
jgi:ZIP family zinc transporter